MKLLHYSAEPFTFDPTRTYPPRDHFKPTGLWLSVEGDDDWRAWCEGENFSLPSLKYVSEVTLKPGHNVLVVDTLEALDAFNARFGVADPLAVRGIRWDEVRALYDGLIIAPYRWERRLDLMWYYGWDCASGVIWNASAIESVARADRLGS